MTAHQIAILVSGSGTNAVNIIEYFEKKSTAQVTLIISNKEGSQVLKKAQDKGVENVVFNNESFKNSGEVLTFLQSKSIDFIVLAGFLLKIPRTLLAAYPKKIINIHPSLLPKFGGKGMYGGFVHEAVIKAQEKESGITIHFVNEEYDEGTIIFQSKLTIEKKDTAESLAKKVKQLEHRYFPEVIEQVISKSL